MSKADEMFEELGYEKTAYGKTRICYSKELDLEGYCILAIWFDKLTKSIRVNGHYSMQELQAINEKCKELRWLDE